MRADLKREMDAHVRTLDQLPTAVAIFNGAQRLAFANAAYQRLWQLDPAFLAPVADGRRGARPPARPAQAARAGGFPCLEGGRARRPTAPSSRARPGGTCPTGARCASSSNPNPQGGVTYLFDDVSEQVQLESQVTALTRVQSETLDTLKEGVAVFGTDGRLKLSNRAFRRDVAASRRRRSPTIRISTR